MYSSIQIPQKTALEMDPSLSLNPKIVVGIPLDRNKCFKGRDRLLIDIFSLFETSHDHNQNRRIALSGLGGIGKTQIALEYCFRYRERYTHVFWVRAAEHFSLLSDLAEIAIVVECVPDSTHQSTDALAKAALRWLWAAKNWLLIIDNLDDLAIAKGYLPSTDSGGHTLITTRNPDTAAIPAEGFEVDIMESSDAVSFLLSRANLPFTPPNEAEAAQIVEELGYLPLAIETAAAYIRNSQKISSYLKLWRENPRTLLSHRVNGVNVSDQSVFTTWN